ncbi:tyrosine lyase ThiH [Alteromonadaceae bacterium Bs31]|nr:tyrosine lyase ThiH [Alteromonadaceae bacterium Bs31]
MPQQFSSIFRRYHWQDIEQAIESKTSADVERALCKQNLSPADFQALLSPAAEQYLETMAQKSRALTQQQFGHTMQLYAPLYLSNVCSNICSYCGFSINNKLRRKTLDEAEILAEAKALKRKGINNVLLVTGEAPKTVGVEYIERAIQILKVHFAQIHIEVQPLQGQEYGRLIASGMHGVSLYQETYHRASYREHHTKGNKTNMDARLNAPDQIGQQGVHKIGLGVLLGLANWRTDSLFCALHLRHLQKHYWRTRYAISFPRLRPCAGDYTIKHPVTDRQLVQLITAWRLFDNTLDLNLSTREQQDFRDAVCQLGITSMSAESSTQPGGYAENTQAALQQFEISDERSVEQVHSMLNIKGLEVIHKDWHWA